MRRPDLLAPTRGDFVAGLTVALVLVPQSMAYAEIAGLDPQYGLYAAVAAPIAGALVGSSPYLQTGPAPITSLLTFGALAGLASPHTESFAVLAAGVAVMVGVVRLVLGLLHGGMFAFLMSQPVVVSFTFAAAVIIVASQIPALLGVDAAGANPVTAASSALSHPSAWSAPDLVVGLLTVVVMLGGRQIAPRFPGALVAVVVATAWSMWTGYDGSVVGGIPVRWTSPGLPALTGLTDLLLPTLVIALVGFAEPAAIARRYAAEDRKAWNPNRELVGQGLANLASGLAAGYPVGGSFSRTALNRLSGARTRWSGAVTGLAVLAFLPIIDLLAPLPKATLAGIVIGAVASLLDLRPIADYWRLSRPQFGVAALTIVSTLVAAPHVERGVLLGIGAALAVHLWREVHVVVPAELDADTLHLRPTGVLYFGSAPALEQQIDELVTAHPNITHIIVHLARIGRLDLTGALMLRDLFDDATSRGIQLELVDAAPAQTRLLRRILNTEDEERYL